MAGKKFKKKAAGRRAIAQALERRVLLSDVMTPIAMAPLLPAGPAGTVTPMTSAAPTGITPAQMRTAYGVSSISFNGIAGTGAGQTIAIVDAYNDPNIQSDLTNFDSYFGLSAPPSFTVMSQTGSTTSLPAANSGWITEIALDVEWSHVIAPGASIDLVEASSSSTSDLFTAVNTARNLTGVSAVTMSWGGGELSTDVSTYDSYFTTPAGHNGVTFLASTGDNGSYYGVSYPAASPNVVAVGGTTLSYGSTGAYLGEAGWSGSGGGISAYETQPTYQKGVVTQSATYRTNPDVAFDADPNSGVPVYDSYNNGTAYPWGQWGGTSLSSPCFAGLVAIANQDRALNGLGSLDGVSQTLPALYSLPATDFHDITSGSTGLYSAGAGYDLVTGRGSPVANLLVPALNGIHLSMSSIPTVATVNQNLGGSSSVVVTETDGSGNVVTTDQAAITLSLSNGGTFASTGTSSITVNAVNGVAAFGALSIGTVGSYTLTATQGSLTTSQSLVVTAATRLVVASAPAGGSVGSPLSSLSVDIAAGTSVVTTGPGVPITATWSGSETSLSGSVTTVTTAAGIANFSNLIPAIVGSYTLTFSAGSLTSASTALAIAQGATALSITSSTNNSYGYTNTVNVSVTSAGSGAAVYEGLVTFTVLQNGVTLLTATGSVSNGAASTTFAGTLNPGSYTVAAAYADSAGNYTSSTATPVPLTVGKTVTTTTVTSSGSSLGYGVPLTFTATVTPNLGVGVTGTVQFKIDGANVGNPVSLSGNIATYTIATLLVGSHSITAIYSGDGNFNASTSSTFTQTVVKATAGTTWAISTLGTFNSSNGRGPYAAVVADSSGDLFGTTETAGANGYGTVFEIVHGSGVVSTLASFNYTNGAYPYAGVALDSSGNIFGTTEGGGANGYGTVFEISHGSAAITTLVTFNYTNGSYPYYGSVVLDAAGNIFGTTELGGASGYGTVFEVAHGSSTVTTLASFNSTNGSYPYGGVVLDSSGNLFGAAESGGASGYGTIFEVAHGAAVISTLASFTSTNGAHPYAGVVLDSSGNLFGTTCNGGANSYGVVFELALGASAITALASFNSSYYPNSAGAGVILDSSGDLFGTVAYNGSGAVYEVARGSSSIKVLASFISTNGANPFGSLLLDSSSNLFGTTYDGGAYGDGVVFETTPTTTGAVVTSSTASASMGQPVTFTATILSGVGVTPTGTVQFQIDGSNVGSPVALVGNIATYTTSSLSLGSHSIVAVYSGDTNFASFSSPAFTQNVRTATTTAVTTSNAATTYGQSVTFTATVTPTSGETGTVQFQVDGVNVGAPAALSGNVATLTTSTISAGSHSITAIYSGDGNFGSSISAGISQIVTQVAPTTTTITSSGSSSTYGQSVTFTATITPNVGNGATGTVQFQIDGVNVASPVAVSGSTASYAMTMLSLGAHLITAIYSGDGNFAGSTSLAITQNVGQAASVTAVTSSIASPAVGQAITFTATITPAVGAGPTGTVQFQIDGANVGTPVGLTGGATTLTVPTLSLGAHSIVALYSGDANFTAGVSTAFTQHVGQNTTTVVTSNLASSGFGQTVSFTARVTPSSGSGESGTVQFQIDGVNAGNPVTLSGSIAAYTTSTLTLGSHTIVAIYSGDNNFAASTSAAFTQTVVQASTVTVVSTSNNLPTYGQTVTFTATVTPATGSGETGTVQFQLDGANVGNPVTLTGNTASYALSTLLAAGTHFVDAIYSGSANFSSSTSVTFSQNVAKIAPNTTWAISTQASFNYTNGEHPTAGVVMDSSGNLFGVACYGGANGDGAIYEVANGSTAITLLASFNGTNGYSPYGNLALDASGNLFGTTYYGGASSYGTVFEVAHGSSVITTIASFNGTNGEYPRAGVVLDSFGNLFGDTYQGGASNYGSIFEIAQGSATITTLASFNGVNGEYPYYGGPTLDSSGDLFGTTNSGGVSGYGTVFELAHGATTISTLVSFNSTNGSYPYSAVTFDSSGDLFGTTRTGGTSGYGTVFEIAHGGTSLSTLVSFNSTNGANPYAGVTVDSSGNLFGTTYVGGVYNDGTVYEIAHGSTAITTLTSFNGSNGYYAYAGVVRDAAGNLYGTTYSGGTSGYGDVYELTSTTTGAVVTTSNPSISYGQSVTFTATVTPVIGVGPTGTVQFQSDGVNIGSPVALTGNIATFTTSALGSGTHAITAIYSGDSNYTIAASPAITETVAAAPTISTTTAVTSSSGSPTYGQTVTFTATVTPSSGSGETGTVQFQIDGVNFGSPVPLTGNTATYTTALLAVGSHSVVAVYSGDNNFIKSTSPTFTQNIVTKTASVTTVTSNGASATFGQSVTFTATITPGVGAGPTGTVQFQIDGSSVGSPVTVSGAIATYTISTLTPGAHSIVALYSGDGNFTASTSSAFVQTISHYSTSTVVTSSNGSTTYGQSVTFTATVTPSGGSGETGTVQFQMDGANLGSPAPLSGNTATYTSSLIPAGSHSITAIYSGDGNFSGGTSAAMAQNVAKITVNTSLSLSTLASFNSSNGANSYSGVVLDSSGDAFGSTKYGGAYNDGAVFEVAHGSAAITVLASFNNVNGLCPLGGVTLDTAGNLFGTTWEGAAGGLGGVFEVAHGSGAITLLASFNNTNGEYPWSRLTLDLSGNLYGTTYNGGVAGTVFEIASGSQAITTIVTFSTAGPYGGVVFDSAGDIFGTTSSWISGGGTVFEIAHGSSTYTTLVTFNGANGYQPFAGLAIDSSGDLFGSTYTDGANGDGTVFEVTHGVLTTLAAFNGSNGNESWGGVIVDSYGNLFGTAYAGGASSDGTVFELPRGGSSILVLASFNGTNGANPYGGVTLDGYGDLFGTTYSGGASGDGVVFELAAASTGGLAAAVTSSTPSSTPGQPVTFTATITPSVGAGPTGTVQFQIDGVNVGNPVALVGNTATYSTSSLGVGSHSIVAIYSGDNNYAGVTSAAFTQTVAKIATTTAVTSNNSSPTYGQSVTFTATVTPASSSGETGTVQFQIDGANVGSPVAVSGNIATYTTSTLSVGAHSIVAIYSGDGSFTGSASSTFPQTIAKAATTTAVTSSNGSSTYGQSVTFTATITPSSGAGPTGTVQFQIDGINLGGPVALTGNTATCTTSALGAGSHSVVAIYSGDGNFTSCTSSTFSQTVLKAAASTAITTSNSSPSYGQSVTFTATVTPASGAGETGTVQFQIDGANAGSPVVVVGNVATFITSSLTAGSHSITAIYSGDANFAGSTSSTFTQIVAQAPTATVTTSSSGSTTYGQAVTFTATITPASGAGETGTVQFQIDGGYLGSPVALSGNTATYTASTLNVGAHSITAIYSGDGNFAGSTSSTFTQIVAQAPTATVTTSSSGSTTYGQAVTFTATITPASGSGETGTVQFQIDGANAGSPVVVAGNTAAYTTTLLTAGSHSIVAIYSGDGNFAASTSGALTQNIVQAATATVVTTSNNSPAYGQAVIFTATVTPASGDSETGTVQFQIDGANVGSPVALTGNTATFSTSTLLADGHSIVALYSGDSNFESSTSAEFNQTVAQAVTTTAVTSNNSSPCYGQSVTFTATITPASGSGESGTVQFQIDGESVGSPVDVVGNAATYTPSLLSAGAHSIVAIYSGDGNFTGSTSSTFGETLAQASTSTVVTSSNTSPSYGQSVTFTATVTASSGSGETGTVQFQIDNADVGAPVTLVDGVATYSTSILTAGDHPVVAIYSGDDNFVSSNSATFAQPIGQASTSAAVVSCGGSPCFGQSVTFIATITAASGAGETGTVQFQIDGANVGSPVILSGNIATYATSTLGAGSHSITALYSGDDNFTVSTSSAINQAVGRAGASLAVTSSSASPSYGQLVTFTATVIPATGAGETGTVQFQIDGANVGAPVALVGNSATYATSTLSVGAHSITAVYSGDGNFAGAASSNFSQTISKASATVVAASIGSTTYGNSITFVAKVTPNVNAGPSGTVQFQIDGVNVGGPVAVTAGAATCVASLLSLGNHRVVALYSGDGSFTSAVSAAFVQAVATPPAGCVAGWVYKDVNDSGALDLGESGFAGVTVTLTPTGTTTGAAVSVVSAADGSYVFTAVPTGTYTVSQTPPAGYALSTYAGASANVTVVAGHGAAGPMFGEVLIASVNLNMSMLEEISANYGKPGAFAAGDLNGDGAVNFADLALLSQNYNHTLPAGDYAYTAPAVSQALAVSALTMIPALFPLTPATLATKVATQVQTTGSIAGNVFSDLNGDGAQEKGEAALAGWTVYLRVPGAATRGQLIATTNASGQFSFTGVAAGSYLVVVSLPANWRSTTAPSDSDPITLAGGASVGGLALGQTQTASLAGNVYLDYNANQRRDGGEPGLSGWVITLKNQANSALAYTAVSNSVGNYLIPAAPAGTYVISITPQQGYAPSAPGGGSYTLHVYAAQTLTGKGFALSAVPVTISAVRTVDPLDKTMDLVTFYALDNGTGAWTGSSKVMAEDLTLTCSSGLEIRTYAPTGSTTASVGDFAGLNAAPTASFICLSGPSFFVAMAAPVGASGPFVDHQMIAGFEVAGTLLTSPAPAASGQGAEVAVAVVKHGAAVKLTGSLAADVGSPASVSFSG